MPFGEDEEAGSSTAPEILDTNAVVDDPATEGASTDDNAAASSTVDDEDAKQPASLLDVVKSAVEPVGPVESSAAEGEEEAQAKLEEGAEEASDDGDAEDFSKLPFHKHPRFTQLIEERNSLRGDAQSYQNIQGFMREHGLTAEEMADAYDISAKLKSGDPAMLQSALEWLDPRVEALKAQLGHVLPEDIQARVDAGELDDDSAEELARLRATETLRTQQAERTTEAEAQAEAARTATEAATAVATAVSKWEQEVRGSDPDYAKKASLVLSECQAIVLRTGEKPTNEAKALELVKQAYANVDAAMKAALPQPRPVLPSPRGSSTPAAAQPKSLREAIALAAGGNTVG